LELGLESVRNCSGGAVLLCQLQGHLASKKVCLLFKDNLTCSWATYGLSL